VTRFAPGRELVPGITALAAAGHTPGHSAFAIASGSESLMVLSDTTNNPYVFARHPDWQPIIDVDGPRAVETRRQLLDRASADRMLVHGYHFPFPAVGHIARTATGYDFMPEIWQARL
jgi:glyoxylase-like metal-dependent hydrolase (beta-lactamase superfamily II)